MTAVCLTVSGLQTNIGAVFLKSGKEHIGWAVVPENSLKVLQLSKVIFCVC